MINQNRYIEDVAVIKDRYEVMKEFTKCINGQLILLSAHHWATVFPLLFLSAISCCHRIIFSSVDFN